MGDDHQNPGAHDALGNLVRFVLLPGQRFDTVGVPPLIEGLAFDALIAAQDVQMAAPRACSARIESGFPWWGSISESIDIDSLWGANDAESLFNGHEGACDCAG